VGYVQNAGPRRGGGQRGHFAPGPEFYMGPDRALGNKKKKKRKGKGKRIKKNLVFAPGPLFLSAGLTECIYTEIFLFSFSSKRVFEQLFVFSIRHFPT